MNSIVRRLTVEEMRSLTKQLPSPISSWKVGLAKFDVFRVKDLFDSRWPNEVLYRILVDARGSYYVYGSRPPIDSFDNKSASYLVKVVYPYSAGGVIEDKNFLEEWLSDRLVPGSSKPDGNGELDYFIHDGKHMNYWMRKLFFRDNENYLNYIAASNRMCVIPPYFLCGVADAGVQTK